MTMSVLRPRCFSPSVRCPGRKFFHESEVFPRDSGIPASDAYAIGIGGVPGWWENWRRGFLEDASLGRHGKLWRRVLHRLRGRGWPPDPEPRGVECRQEEQGEGGR